VTDEPTQQESPDPPAEAQPEPVPETDPKPTLDQLDGYFERSRGFDSGREER
jgi:hypothetical protein